MIGLANPQGGYLDEAMRRRLLVDALIRQGNGTLVARDDPRPTDITRQSGIRSGPNCLKETAPAGEAGARGDFSLMLCRLGRNRHA
jgi:hypothetical protein